MTDEALTDSERQEIADAVWQWFRSYLQAGFDRDQSLKLCCELLSPRSEIL